jgi:hypothetical protein
MWRHGNRNGTRPAGYLGQFAGAKGSGALQQPDTRTRLSNLGAPPSAANPRYPGSFEKLELPVN